MSEHPLYQILNPKSVAFVGASNKIQTMGTVHLNTLIHDGFDGPIYPIHPKEKTVLGLKAYPDIPSLPEAPDLLVMLVNRKVVPELITAAGEKGIKRAVIISGGFSEAEDHGPKLQATLKELTDKYGIRIIGPNCIGVLNPWAKMNVTYFPYVAEPGPIGVISHSGTYLCHLYGHHKIRGYGIAEGMSLGNELNIDVTDGIEYFAGRDNVKSIALYLEAVRRPRKFIEVAREVGKNKPIVAHFIGGSEAGARAVAGHTAAMTGREGVLKGLLQQAGVIIADGIERLYDFADALAWLPPMSGKNVAILTNSGGPGASVAEGLEKSGLACPVLSENTQEKIRKLQPHTASAKNPVDFTYFTDMASYYIKAPRILLEDPEIHGLLIYGIFGPDFWEHLLKSSEGRFEIPELEPMRQMADMFFDGLAALPGKYGKPVVAINFDGFSDEATRGLKSRGIPVLPSPKRAVACLKALHKYHKIRNRS